MRCGSCLGSEVVGPSLTRDLITTFLAARFNGGERYVRRLKQIEDLERAMSNA
jgi:ribose 5-phosphate isomerase RpiB